jgi:hypothetical protein
VHAKGVRIEGAKIAGQLDFDSAKLIHLLGIWRSYIEQQVMLQDASARLVGFNGSYLKGGLSGYTLKVDLDLLLNNGFHALDKVLLLRAQIGGQLDCEKGVFENPNGDALLAYGVKVGDKVALEGVHALGKVRLVGARIGADLDCTKGTFVNPNDVALNGTGMKVDGSVYLRDGFHALGAVNLTGAQIGGDLACVGGSFNGQTGMALSLERASIGKLHLWNTNGQPIGGIDLEGLSGPADRRPLKLAGRRPA